MSLSLRDAAIVTGLRICREALWHGDRCTWFTAATQEESEAPRHYFKTVEPRFYDGTVGIAYFLSSLARVSDLPVLRETAAGATRQALATIDRVPVSKRLGFFTGYSGLLALLLLQSRTGGPDDELARNEVLQRMRTSCSQSTALDIIGGVASAIPVVIDENTLRPNGSNTDLLKSMGQLLLDKAQHAGDGCWWQTIDGFPVGLTGYGHGASGIMVGLMQLSQFFDDPIYMRLAMAAHHYEASQFSNSDNNWLDLRRIRYAEAGSKQKPRCANFWCHGAPGIGQARIAAYRMTGDMAFMKDLKVALHSCRASTDPNQPHNGFSLCHGILGNAELVLNADSLLPEMELNRWALDLAKQVATDFIEPDLPIPNGIGSTHAIPGFMTGLAGIGYFMLRASEPDVTPSVLLLETCSADL